MNDLDAIEFITRMKRSVIGDRFFVAQYHVSEKMKVNLTCDYLGTDGSTVKFRVTRKELDNSFVEISVDKYVLEFPLDNDKCNTYSPREHWGLPDIGFRITNVYGDIEIEYSLRDD